MRHISTCHSEIKSISFRIRVWPRWTAKLARACLPLALLVLFLVLHACWSSCFCWRLPEPCGSVEASDAQKKKKSELTQNPILSLILLLIRICNDGTKSAHKTVTEAQRPHSNKCHMTRLDQFIFYACGVRTRDDFESSFSTLWSETNAPLLDLLGSSSHFQSGSSKSTSVSTGVKA